VKLSVKRIHEMERYFDQNDFEFIVDEHHYEYGLFTACFLSDRICQLWKTDNTITSYEIETKDPDGHFKDFLCFGHGQEIVVNPTHWEILLSFCEELDNNELGSLLCNSGELTRSTVLERLKRKSKLKMDIMMEVEFLAKQFDPNLMKI
jgi:hypothetical protein